MGIGIKELLVILIIIMLLFGTKKLKNIGGDLGSAVKGFRKAMADQAADSESATLDHSAANAATVADINVEIGEKK